MKIFVDDIRQQPAGWTLVKTSKQAIELLWSSNVTHLSLDHDLGGEDTGYKVILWMEENDCWPEHVYCHSANPVGKSKIMQAIEKHRERIAQLSMFVD